MKHYLYIVKDSNNNTHFVHEASVDLGVAVYKGILALAGIKIKENFVQISSKDHAVVVVEK